MQLLHLRYWDLAWNGIKYANTVITRVPKSNITNEEDKNQLLAEGYFHRAYWYYLLVHQWGDVPLILEEIAEPKLDFYTAPRMRILQQMKLDLEFVVKWLPKEVKPGCVNRAAGEHLLTKIYLSTGDFEDAVKSATRCIKENGRHLMTERFGINVSNSELDVINDLFNEENISSNENKEAIFVVQERFGMEGNVAPKGANRMRNFVPYWCNGADVKTRMGKMERLMMQGLMMDILCLIL